MELISALQAGSEGISLVSALAKLIQEMKKPGSDASLSEILQRTQIEAVRLSRDLENRLRMLSDRMIEYGLSPALSLNQQLESLHWYNFQTRSRLKAIREECLSIHRQLASFLDDATAVLICSQQQQRAVAAFQASLDSKRSLDRLFLDPNTSLGMLVEGLLATASRASAELQAA